MGLFNIVPEDIHVPLLRPTVRLPVTSVTLAVRTTFPLLSVRLTVCLRRFCVESVNNLCLDDLRGRRVLEEREAVFFFSRAELTLTFRVH